MGASRESLDGIFPALTSRPRAMVDPLSEGFMNTLGDEGSQAKRRTKADVDGGSVYNSVGGLA